MSVVDGGVRVAFREHRSNEFELRGVLGDVCLYGEGSLFVKGA